MSSIFISGAAEGIGRAVAHRFLTEGWTVGAYDIAPVSYSHPNLVAGHLDASDVESWDAALADFTAHTGGTLDVLDNNAGVIAAGALASLPATKVAAQIQVNALGVTLGARAAHRYLAATEGSQLVNMASASAIYGQPDIAVYSATKSYVGGLTEALGLEWEPDGIRVIDIWPLWAKTKLSDNDATSVRRLGVHITPEQIAEVIWDATHPANRWQRGKIHYGVSLLDKAMYWARSVSPDRTARFVNRFISA
ncbi:MULTISPECIES: SDR family oxidoreductase [Corynebacterium]|uniref:SDR family oxidoreductase n=1 Tax=Corynebacterium TaxID=1716 RepID=UPI00254B53C4|nr:MULTISPECIES: SDR family oxidoreductase [Corynebacterium]MDK8894789.1 SDR family oxidoreductase [Corynebacterium sp. MSK006]